MKRWIVCMLGGTVLSLAACRPPQPPPPPIEYVEHRVSHPGETLTLISSWYTGSARNWPQIHEHNPELDLLRMRIGESVRIPRALARREDPFGRAYIDRAWQRKKRLLRSADGSSRAMLQPVSASAAAAVDAELPLLVEALADENEPDPARREAHRERLLQEIMAAAARR